jgi:ATPase family associated with various cellular activities (AAA)
MSAGGIVEWREHNRELLALALDGLLARLRGEQDDPGIGERLAALRREMAHPPAIDVLSEAFGLNQFECEVVLRCLAAEVDPRFRMDPRPVTVDSVLETLDGAHWSAFDLSSPLRSWGILEFEDGGAIGDAHLRLAPDVLRLLLGFDPREEPAAAFSVISVPPGLGEEHEQAAIALAKAILVAARISGSAPVVELHGSAEEDRVALATACAVALEATLLTMDAADLPEQERELDALVRGWARRARATGSLLCLILAADEHSASIERRIAHAIERIPDPVFLSVERSSIREPTRPLIRHPVERLDTAGRLAVWSACVEAMRRRLGARRTRGLAESLELLASQFRLGARTIQRVCLQAEGRAHSSGVELRTLEPSVLVGWLREACVGAIDARLGPVAERVAVERRVGVVLPEAETRLLDELASQIRLSRSVEERWSAAGEGPQAPVALFAGPSGTGKTHAAAALAHDCGLALYRIDISSVLSKYVGETESNLERVFEAASSGGSILLFDEADALFGKRSEVRDSHDRYANIGTSYLLQRIERTPTPIVLTSNLKEAIDPAFLRRLHVIIDFPFPGEAEREAIWREVFPPSIPLGALEPKRLARVAVSGATIRNIARRGAFLAAAEDSEVEMAHLLESTERELRQSGRSLSAEELSAWR